MINHIALIPDGNRRWAAQNGVDLKTAYSAGADSVFMFIESCINRDIQNITIWPLSQSNWQRSNEEIEIIINQFECFLGKIESLLHLHRIALVHAGRISKIEKEFPRLAQKIHELVSITQDYASYKLYVAFDYSGDEEILLAVRSLVSSGIVAEDIDIDIIRSELQINESVDLLIRTGGERRLSGFLPIQLAYSELYFCEQYLPDFSEEHINSAINSYDQRYLSQE